MIEEDIPGASGSLGIESLVKISGFLKLLLLLDYSQVICDVIAGAWGKNSIQFNLSPSALVYGIRH